MVMCAMSNRNKSRHILVAQKNDLPMSSILGYLTLRAYDKGKEKTVSETVDAFRWAGDVAFHALGPAANDKGLSLTSEFFSRAEDRIFARYVGKSQRALRQAITELREHRGLG